jgi:hypothetical protein
MQKVRLSNLKTHKVEMEDGSFVEIKGLMDYSTYKLFIEKFKNVKEEEKEENKTNLDFFNVALDFLKTVIVKWNFVDAEGKIIEFSPEWIDHLDLETIQELMEKSLEFYMPEKKN